MDAQRKWTVMLSSGGGFFFPFSPTKSTSLKLQIRDPIGRFQSSGTEREAEKLSDGDHAMLHGSAGAGGFREARASALPGKGRAAALKVWRWAKQLCHFRSPTCQFRPVCLAITNLIIPFKKKTT